MACNEQRPCKRCVHTGRECRDLVQKKRGRPALAHRNQFQTLKFGSKINGENIVHDSLASGFHLGQDQRSNLSALSHNGFSQAAPSLGDSQLTSSSDDSIKQQSLAGSSSTSSDSELSMYPGSSDSGQDSCDLRKRALSRHSTETVKNPLHLLSTAAIGNIINSNAHHDSPQKSEPKPAQAVSKSPFFQIDINTFAIIAVPDGNPLDLQFQDIEKSKLSLYHLVHDIDKLFLRNCHTDIKRRFHFEQSYSRKSPNQSEHVNRYHASVIRPFAIHLQSKSQRYRLICITTKSIDISMQHIHIHLSVFEHPRILHNRHPFSYTPISIHRSSLAFYAENAHSSQPQHRRTLTN